MAAMIDHDAIQSLARKLHGRLTAFGSPTLRYLDELTKCKCAPDLLAIKVFPNAKEVTESFGAYNAVRTHLSRAGWRLDDPTIAVVCVGDGCTPRTAATFAYRSAWKCWSVDPLLKGDWSRVARLTVLPHMVEACSFDGADRVVIVAVHSHAPLDAAVRAVHAREIAVVAMPCCVRQMLPQRPDVAYLDWGVWSPERMVMVWRNVLAATGAAQ